MSQITGTFIDGAVARARVPIKFTYLSSPAVAGTFGVTTREPVATETDEVGQFSQALAMGDWEMLVDGHDRYIIAVPNDTAEHNFKDLIVSAVATAPSEPIGSTGICLAENETSLTNSYEASSANRIAILWNPATAGHAVWRWDNASEAAHDAAGGVINPAGNTGAGRWIWVDVT